MSNRHPYHDKNTTELLELSEQYVALLAKMVDDEAHPMTVKLTTDHLDYIFHLIAQRELKNGS